MNKLLLRCENCGRKHLVEAEPIDLGTFKSLVADSGMRYAVKDCLDCKRYSVHAFIAFSPGK